MQVKTVIAERYYDINLVDIDMDHVFSLLDYSTTLEFRRPGQQHCLERTLQQPAIQIEWQPRVYQSEATGKTE
jgi:hypothetical protein